MATKKTRLKKMTPSTTGLRSPTSTSKVNGDFVNPPLYPEMGGMSGPHVLKRNGYNVVSPGKVK